MGEIIDKKGDSTKVIYKISLSQKEAKQVKNHMKKIHLFSGDLCYNRTKLIQRGNNGGAKYFIVPLSLKSRKKLKYSKVNYQKIEHNEKIYYICTAIKNSEEKESENLYNN